MEKVVLGYRVYDTQLNKFKEDLPIYQTKQEAYECYGESLYEQCLDGNCGYDEHTHDEIVKILKNKTYKDLFDMFEYEVVEV